MTLQEIIIYLSQLVFILIGIFFFRKKFFQFLSLRKNYLLYFSSISLAFISAYLGAKCYEYDSYKYIQDSKLLLDFIQLDRSYLGLFFLSGGNSLYPSYFFPMLIASNTWSNYTSFTIEKYFLLFSIISKPNLFNVSLFFGTLAFGSKLMLMSIADRLKLNSKSKNLLFGYLLLGGLDLFFCSGLYKETLIFFFISYTILFQFLKKTKLQILFFIFCLIQLVFLRFELGFIVISLFGLNQLYQWQQAKSPYFYKLLALFIGVIMIIIQPIYEYILDRKARFEIKKGLTWIETPSLDQGFFDYFSGLIISILKFIYYPLSLIDSKFIVSDLVNLATLSFIIYLCFHFQLRFKKVFLFCILLLVSSSILIIHLVPNSYTQLRYRAPFLVLLIFSLILNQKDTLKKNIYEK